MAKYRVIYKPNAIYEGRVQRKLLGFWWTISKHFFLYQAESRFKFLLQNNGNRTKVIMEAEI